MVCPGLTRPTPHVYPSQGPARLRDTHRLSPSGTAAVGRDLDHTAPLISRTTVTSAVGWAHYRMRATPDSASIPTPYPPPSVRKAGIAGLSSIFSRGDICLKYCSREGRSACSCNAHRHGVTTGPCFMHHVVVYVFGCSNLSEIGLRHATYVHRGGCMRGLFNRYSRGALRACFVVQFIVV